MHTCMPSSPQSEFYRKKFLVRLLETFFQQALLCRRLQKLWSFIAILFPIPFL
jgi:hypothetical protein